MLNLNHLSEALRIFRRSRIVKNRGIKQYNGNANKICRQIIEDCWNGRYFQVSAGHFCEFYIRDFGFCIDSLLKLGYKDKVLKTLEYALSVYSKQRLTTTIIPSGKCIDVFDYSPDSLAFLLRCLRISDAKELVETYRAFLLKETNKYFNLVIDKKTGLVRTDRKFSSIKDQSIRKSSCYDNCMTAMLSNELDKLKMSNPFKAYDYKKLIKDNFWTGNYFLDDLSGERYIAGDANIFPFWTGIFDDREMLKKCISSIQKEGLDKPFPLKYTKNAKRLNFVSSFSQNYEGTSVWMHIGPLFVFLVKKIDRKKAADYLDVYTNLIKKYKNFIEVFNPDGTPYKSQFYHADEGMLWAANYLALKEE